MSFLDFKNAIDNTFEQYSSKNAISFYLDNDSKIDFKFADIYKAIKEFKPFLSETGIFEGDRIAVVTPHSPFGIVAGFSIAYAHCTVVLVDASLPAEEIIHLLELSDVRLVLAEKSIYEKAHINDFSAKTGIPVFEIGSSKEKFIYVPFDENKKVSNLPKTKDPDLDVIAIIFSSGTTSQMKGVMLTYSSQLLARDIFVRLAGLTPEMSYFLVLPFNHIAGFTGAMTYLLTGCTLGMIETVNGENLQKGLKKFEPSYFAMVPKIYEIMEQKIRQEIRAKGKSVEILLNNGFAFSRFLRKKFGINIGKKLFGSILSQVFGKNIFGLGSGASPMPGKTTAFYLNMGVEWANLYATTETGVPIAATGVLDRYPIDTVGNVNRHPEIEIRINNPDEEGVGEIYVKTKLIMKGYFRDPELTKAAFDGEYFKTGDSGYIDKSGNLFVTGRIKESILLQNGKKVSPVDVDGLYAQYLPKGCSIASCGIEVKESGYEEIYLFVELGVNGEYDKEKIKEDLLKASATKGGIYKVSEVVFVDKIPLTGIGKVKRYLLKDMIDNNILNITDEKKEKHSDDSNKSLLELVVKYANGIKVSDETNLRDDLGIDSLSMFEMVVAIEDKFGVSIINQMGEIKTFSDLKRAVIYHDYSNYALDVSGYPKLRNDSDIKRLFDVLDKLEKIYEIKIDGIENVPIEEPLIICANHQSNLDPFLILAGAKKAGCDISNVYSLAAVERMNAEEADMLRLIGGIPVDRFGNSLPAIVRSKELLAENKSLVIFPEGARSRDGSMLELKNGVGYLSKESNKKILPVKIEGAFEVFPRHISKPKKFNWKTFKKYEMRITFMPVINPMDKSKETIMEELRACINPLHKNSGGN